MKSRREKAAVRLQEFDIHVALLARLVKIHFFMDTRMQTVKNKSFWKEIEGSICEVVKICLLVDAEW